MISSHVRSAGLRHPSAECETETDGNLADAAAKFNNKYRVMRGEWHLVVLWQCERRWGQADFPKKIGAHGDGVSSGGFERADPLDVS